MPKRERPPLTSSPRSDDEESDDDDDFGWAQTEEAPAPARSSSTAAFESSEAEQAVDVAWKKVQLQGASSCAARTLMREFKSLKLLEMKGGLDGIGVEISDDADGFTWKALITAPEDDPKLPLLLGLRRFAELTAHEFPAAVELELSFTKNFPFDPPFVRVVRPRFDFMTGHVTQSGSICIELLTASGWSPAYSLESLLVQLRALFVSGNAKIDTKSHLKKMAYGKKTALENFRRVAGVHGWKV